MFTLWKWLNGKKTAIGALILAVIPLLQQFGVTIPVDCVNGLTYLGQLLVGGGLIHKAVKK